MHGNGITHARSYPVLFSASGAVSSNRFCAFEYYLGMPISKELKTAILGLTREEKDKLLLRLINKHKDLQEQLIFQLLEDGQTLPERRDDLRNKMDRFYKLDPDSSGWLMTDMRRLHAEIAYHVKITKDKYGEVELVLYLLNECFEKQLSYVQKYTSKTDSLAEYIAKRTEAILKKLTKLHPDIQFEFLEDVNHLLERVYAYAPAPYAKQLGLPKRMDIR